MWLVLLESKALGSDAAALGRAHTVVRHGGHVLDGADLQAGGGQGPDGGLATGARALDEHVDLAHAVLHGAPGGGLGGHLGGERRRLARALEAHLAGGRPRDHGAGRVRDRDDRVVERALDVSVPGGDVLLLLAAHLLGARGGTALGRHLLGTPEFRGLEPRAVDAREGLLLAARLRLAGHGALGPLAAPRVGLGALTAHRQATAVPQPLVAADLDLAADVGSDLATQVALELEARLEVVTQPDEVLVGQVTHADVGADPGRLQRLGGARAPHAEDVGERDLDALVAREVDADQTCHLACLLVWYVRRSGAAPFPTRWWGPRPPRPGVSSRAGARGSGAAAGMCSALSSDRDVVRRVLLSPGAACGAGSRRSP